MVAIGGGGGGGAKKWLLKGTRNKLSIKATDPTTSLSIPLFVPRLPSPLTLSLLSLPPRSLYSLSLPPSRASISRGSTLKGKLNQAAAERKERGRGRTLGVGGRGNRSIGLQAGWTSHYCRLNFICNAFLMHMLGFQFHEEGSNKK